MIYYDDDGDIYVHSHTKEVTEEYINDKYSGFSKHGFMESLTEHNPALWKGSCLIIKGEIIIPKEEKVVVKLVLE